MASPHVKLQLLRSVHAALEECAAAASADTSMDAGRQVSNTCLWLRRCVCRFGH